MNLLPQTGEHQTKSFNHRKTFIQIMLWWYSHSISHTLMHSTMHAVTMHVM